MYKDPLKKYSILTQPSNNKLYMLDNMTVTYISDDCNQYRIWGTPFCKIFGNWAYMHEPEILKAAYESMPERCDIVISHDAPRLCGLGVIHQRMDRENVGNPWLADEIMRKHPKYTFCGHIHSGEHELQTLDDMKMANVSLVDERYEVAYEPLYLEI